jgi:hypothetical protein
MVIQVLVLAVQNAVDYAYLGVATSGSTLFRQIGGSIGVAVFGAIFANRLANELAASLPPGVRTPASPNPAALKHLPSAIQAAYATAITEALRPIFLTAAAAAVLAFALTWLLREVPLRTTTQAPDPGAGFHGARDVNALRELERSLSLLAGREQRWQLYERLAGRAGIELPPPELWLLARLGEREPLSEDELGELSSNGQPIDEALERLRERSLVDARDDGTIALTEPGREDYERLVAAKCSRLHELLDGWNPEQHAELQQLIDALGRDLVSQIPVPPTPADSRA